MQLWIQRYPQLLIDFPQRARELVPITNESVEFLLQTGKILLTSNGELEISPASKTLSKTNLLMMKFRNVSKKANILPSGLQQQEKSRQYILSWG